MTDPKLVSPALAEGVRQQCNRAREAVTKLRDAVRDGVVINHHKRDPLVLAIHDVIDLAEAAVPPRGEKDSR